MKLDDGDGEIRLPAAHPSPLRRGAGGEVIRAPYLRDTRSVAAARLLRGEPTDAERLLWARLRRDRLGIRFRRQHPIGSFVVDFFAAELRLAIELDGGQHAIEVDRDQARTARLAAEGICVLRFWNSEVMQNMGGVLNAISAVIAFLREASSPLTPLRSGGGDAAGALRSMNLRLSLPGVAR